MTAKRTHSSQLHGELSLSTQHIAAASVVCIAILVTLLISWLVGREETLEFQNHFSTHARLLGRQVDSIFQERIRSIDRMGERWERAKGTPKDVWEVDAGNYVRNMPGIQAIALVDAHGRIKWISPEQGNEKAIGFDLNLEPVHREALERARRTHQVALSGMVKFIQGGHGIQINKALYIDGRLDGYIVAAYHLADALQALNAEEHWTGYSISLMHRGQPEFVAPPRETNPDLVRDIPLILGDGLWSLRLQISPQQAADERSHNVSSLLLFSGLCVSALLAGLFMFWLKAAKTRFKNLELETRWRFAVEGGGQGLWDWNVGTNHVFFSHRWKEMLGYSDIEIGDTLKEWETRIHPDDLEATLTKLNKHLRGELVIFMSDFRMLCKDGSYKWIQGRGHVMEWDSDGKPLRLLGTHTDIDDRKALENRLLQQERDLRSILDNAPVGIWRQDANGHLLFVNRWFCSAVGIPEEKFLAVEHYSELYDDVMARRCIASDMATMVTDGPLVSHEQIMFTDGQLHDLEITKVKLETEDMGGGLIGISADITERIKMDQKLSAQEHKMRQILENQSVATFIIDHHHCVQQWNRACEVLTGIPARDIIGKPEAWRGFYPSERPCLADLVLESKQTESSNHYAIQAKSTLLETGWHAEAWFDNVGGKRRYVIFDAAPIVDKAGNITSVVETLQDITEQKRIEESLRETENRFRVIADSAPVLIWMADTKQYCDFFNKAWLDFTGRSLEQEVDWGWANNLHPEDRERCIEIYNYRSQARIEFEMEYRMRRHDGQYRWMTVHGVPRFTPEGEFVGYIGSCVDIEQGKRDAQALLEGREAATQALRALEHQKFALDQHAIVDISDIRGHITYANDKFCTVSGYQREELIGQDHALLNSGHHPQGFFKEMYDTIGRGNVWHREVCNRAKDGHLFWMDTTVIPFLGNDGTPEQFIAIRTDITERKHAELELQRHRDHLQEMVYEQTEGLLAAKDNAESANRAKSEFLTNMSHELRTPMHAILSFSELGSMNADTASPEKLKSYFQRVHSSGERLLNLLNDLLDLSKLEAGKMLLELQHADLKPLVEECMDEFETLAASRQIHVTLEPPTCPTSTMVDAKRYGQIVRNLLSNAIKFTPTEGKITLRFQLTELRHGRRVEDTGTDPAISLEIIDSGIGIPESELETVFDKFVQSSHTKNKAGGTGLGLSICKELIEAHHGTIFARHNPAGGSIFTITLPLINSRKQTAKSESP